MQTVSYTHLDVYKRQALSPGTAEPLEFAPASAIDHPFQRLLARIDDQTTVARYGSCLLYTSIKILDDLPDRSDLRVREWLDFREGFERELKAICVKNITNPERYLLLAAKGDELLDWRLMRSHYQGAHQIVLEGGDHGLSLIHI